MEGISKQVLLEIGSVPPPQTSATPLSSIYFFWEIRRKNWMIGCVRRIDIPVLGISDFPMLAQSCVSVKRRGPSPLLMRRLFGRYAATYGSNVVVQCLCNVSKRD